MRYFYLPSSGLHREGFRQGLASLGYLGANEVLICASVYQKLQLSPIFHAILYAWNAREASAIKFTAPLLPASV